MTNPTHTRRDFLCAAGGLALAALPGGALAAESLGQIPIGFLGVTHSHGIEKLRLLLNSPDFEVIGVCEESPKARAECEKLGAPLRTREELLQRAQVIAVEGPVRDHAPDALAAIRAGRHVHVEKPAAVTMAQMKELVAAAKEKKVLLQCGYMWRHHAGVTAIREAARAGWLGDITMIRGAISNNLGAARRPEWAEFPGGGMFELGSHLIDAVVRLMGRPTAVTPILRTHGGADALRDNNVAILEYPRALAVIMNTTLQAAGTPARSFEVIGSNGSAVLQPIEPPALRLDLAKPAGPYAAGVQEIPMTYRRYEADFVALAAAIRGERPLAVSPDEERLVQETLLRASGME